MLIRRRPSALRLIALAVASVAALAVVLGATLSAAQAAPVGKLTQFKVPTDNSQPRDITVRLRRQPLVHRGQRSLHPRPRPRRGRHLPPQHR